MSVRQRAVAGSHLHTLPASTSIIANRTPPPPQFLIHASEAFLRSALAGQKVAHGVQELSLQSNMTLFEHFSWSIGQSPSSSVAVRRSCRPCRSVMCCQSVCRSVGRSCRSVVHCQSLSVAVGRSRPLITPVGHVRRSCRSLHVIMMCLTGLVCRTK